jgi:hypothetical protein
MSAKQRAARSRKIAKTYKERRQNLWPELTDDDFWSKDNKGFVCIPRCMPIIMLIMDYLSPNKPLSKTYFSLWCRCFDEMLVRADNQIVLAMEAGFSGERQVTTWKSRVDKLEELGFIKKKKGFDGEMIVLLNPFKIILGLFESEKNTPSLLFLKDALETRVLEVGSNDIINLRDIEEDEE